MDLIDKYIKESESKEKEALSSMGQIEFSTLKNSYYGIGDNIDGLVKWMDHLNGKNNGLFKKDLQAAKDLKKAFYKIKIGKYI